MSRFFLYVKPDGIPATESEAEGLQAVISGFADTDAPLYHHATTNHSVLLLAGQDQAVDFQDCSFRTGSALDHESHGHFSTAGTGFVSLICHSDRQSVKITSNRVGGRSAWYYKDEHCFIFSSSQRAIIRFLGSFELNEQAMAWMLATGNLGPGHSWDRRLMHLGADALLTLKRETWKLEHRIGITEEQFIPSENPKDLDKLMESVFAQTSFHKQHDILALSGGFDSRVILNKMNKQYRGMDTVTWGLIAAREEKDSDAFIAAQVARSFGVTNRYFATDLNAPDFPFHIEKFLRAGEGRLDHINSFMDGLFMWNKLSSEKYRIMYRADEVFGWLPCSTEKDVRISLDFHFMEDNSNMLPLQKFDLPRQEVPERFARRDMESLASWRDRLYRTFRIPFVLTSLHDVGSSYFEIFNPLLHDTLIRYCISLSDSDRTSKYLYTKYVQHLEPRMPFARKASIPEPFAILRSARFVASILDEFHQGSCRNLFGRDFLQWIENHLKVDDDIVNRTNDSLILWLKSQVPWQLKKKLRQDLIQYRSDFNQLAFRTYMVSRMIRLLKEDSQVLKVKVRVNA